MELTQLQKKRIHEVLALGIFNLDDEIENLVGQGFSMEEAAIKIQEELDIHRQKLFQQKIKKQKSDEYGKIALAILVIAAVVGPVFNITHPFWFFVSYFIAIVMGYLLNKQQPVAGIIGGMCLVFCFSITYSWYPLERMRMIKIEFLIPLSLALLPSVLIGYVISILFYPKR